MARRVGSLDVAIEDADLLWSDSFGAVTYVHMRCDGLTSCFNLNFGVCICGDLDLLLLLFLK